MLYLLILFTQADCFDIEIEGAVKFGNDLLRILNNEVEAAQFRVNENSVNSYSESNPTKHHKIGRHALMQHNHGEVLKENDTPVTGNVIDVITEKYDQHLPVRGKMINVPSERYDRDIAVVDKMIDASSKKQNKEKNDFNFKHQLSKSGSHKLMLMGHYIKNNLKINRDIDLIVHNSIFDYKFEVMQYFDNISQKVVKNLIEKELVTLDMVESANLILLKQAKLLLNEIITEANNYALITVTNKPLLMDHIHRTVIQEKKEQITYVCNVFDVCRIFPGFSDDIAKLIGELLQMTDEKLGAIITSFKEVVIDKLDFLDKVMNIPTINELHARLSRSLDDLPMMKKILTAVRSAITHRYKIFNRSHSNVSVEAKAVGILIDIIDKAFSSNDDILNTKNIAVTISKYKEFASGSRNDVDSIAKAFITHAFHILDIYWSTETKMEVKVLTDILFTGKTNDDDIYQYLFETGSKFARGD